MMSSTQTHRPYNNVLNSVTLAEWDRLKSCLAPVSLVRKQVLMEHGQPSEHIYFIESGVISLVVKAAPGLEAVQVAMIGREGLVGSLAFGPERHGELLRVPACARAVVNIAGSALRMRVTDLQRAAEAIPALKVACTQAMCSLLGQVMDTASSNIRRNSLERCARWLMMAHERVDHDDVPVTHEGLSEMLGINRPSITVAAAALQEAGLIRMRRGRLTVLDRAGLARVAAGAEPRPPAPALDSYKAVAEPAWRPAVAARRTAFSEYAAEIDG